ncbi:MAG: DUF2156 domain-containing protein [Spirochaetaceae bacterium]|nr:MAG: DUF2156 domain-containing protein [Spirochaetaceae bacterium]
MISRYFGKANTVLLYDWINIEYILEMVPPEYPSFLPINIASRELLHPKLNLLADGVSEHTFAGLYLFRQTYDYHWSLLPDGKLILAGQAHGQSFTMFPEGLPADAKFLRAILKEYDYIRGASGRIILENRDAIEKAGGAILEDRDNFDYLYDKSEMAELPGKKFHKKRNLIHNFERSYPEHHTEIFTANHIPAALSILELWRQQAINDGDYVAAREAIELFEELDLHGLVTSINGKPKAFALGENLPASQSCIIHVEKGDHEAKGIYQYIFREFARQLPQDIKIINREQDVGDPGLRQAKETYRPIDFTRKYQIWPADSASIPDKLQQLTFEELVP